jgi:hypothetical protein
VGKTWNHRVYPDPKFFEEFVENFDTLEDAANAMGVSKPWLNICLAGGQTVSQKKIAAASVQIGRSLKSMTQRPSEYALSEEPNYYHTKDGEKWNSVYLDYNRREPGLIQEAMWWTESIELKHIAGGIKSIGFSAPAFRATVKNVHGVKFAGTAFLLNSFHFVVVGRQSNSAAGPAGEGIVLSFTEKFVVNDKDVLVGTWTGSDICNVNTRVFRNLMSRECLTLDEIKEVAKRGVLLEHGRRSKVGK